MTAPTTFAALGLSPPILTALAELGYVRMGFYDRFTFLEVPAEYRARILERMVNVEIRNRPVHVKLASPSAHGGRAPAGDRKGGAGKPFRKAGKQPFEGRAATRRRRPRKGKRA